VIDDVMCAVLAPRAVTICAQVDRRMAGSSEVACSRGPLSPRAWPQARQA